jgi:hypothetical protein
MKGAPGPAQPHERLLNQERAVTEVAQGGGFRRPRQNIALPIYRAAKVDTDTRSAARCRSSRERKTIPCHQQSQRLLQATARQPRRHRDHRDQEPGTCPHYRQRLARSRRHRPCLRQTIHLVGHESIHTDMGARHREDDRFRRRRRKRSLSGNAPEPRLARGAWATRRWNRPSRS